MVTSVTQTPGPSESAHVAGDKIDVTQIFIQEDEAVAHSPRIVVELVPTYKGQRMLIHWHTEVFTYFSGRVNDEGGMVPVYGLTDVSVDDISILSMLFAELEDYLLSSGASVDFASWLPLNGQVLVGMTATAPASEPIKPGRNRF